VSDNDAMFESPCWLGVRLGLVLGKTSSCTDRKKGEEIVG